jgi:hypothetical protein
MSKSHPNSSSEFAKKQLRRKERAPDRERLKMAKEIYNQRYGKPLDGAYPRNRINSIKAELLEDMQINAPLAHN